MVKATYIPVEVAMIELNGEMRKKRKRSSESMCRENDTWQIVCESDFAVESTELRYYTRARSFGSSMRASIAHT